MDSRANQKAMVTGVINGDKLRRGVALVCMLVTAALAQPLHAQELSGTGPGGAITPKDVRRLFEDVLFSTCADSLKPMVDNFKTEIPQVTKEPNLDRNVCRCTVQQAMAGQGMRKIFEMPPEKLQNISVDSATMNYFKGKVAANMLLCLGAQLDVLVEPKGKHK